MSRSTCEIDNIDRYRYGNRIDIDIDIGIDMDTDIDIDVVYQPY